MTDTSEADFIALQQALAGRYSLERELGRGGMGIVYLAHEVALDRPVALKLLPPQMAAESKLRERFMREARTAAKLSHPNIVPIFTVDEVERFVFFAMAYVPGRSLGARLRSDGAIAPSEAGNILRQVAWALAHAHAQGVVHRDIKPDNVLLEEESGRALVADFGIAHVLEEPGATAAGEVLGTAEFMSPEQASGEPVDARSDIYALGVLGFHMFSGRLPFEGSSARTILAMHLTQAPPPLREVAPETPRRLAAVIDRCLCKDPAERYADGQALAEALGGALEVRRELPVPIRVFLKHNRESLRNVGVIAAVTTIFVGPSVVAGMFMGAWPAYAAGLGIAALLGATPLAILGRAARRLMKSGYGYQDALDAVKADLERRREEIAFEYGAEATPLERISRIIAYAGLGGTALGIGALLLGVGPPEAAALIMGVCAVPGIGAGLIASHRYQRRTDLVGERRLKFWKRRIGQWLFKIAGIGVKRVPFLGSATYRPTELAIGMAADRLFEGLPKEIRKDLADLPQVVRQLETDAQRMRRRVEELSELLTQIGRVEGARTLAAAQAGSRELPRRRDEVADQVRAARDLAQQRMTDAVAALEAIRLSLLRMQAGGGSVAGLTQDLEAGREVAEQVELLLQGRLEVEAALEDEDD